MLNLPLAFDAYQKARQIPLADGKRQLSAQAPQSEVSATKESLAFHRSRRLHHGRHSTDRTFREINAGHGLINL